jgi:hypothetical protein
VNRNATTPFTYAVNFTNTTSKALFTLSAPYGDVTLSFSGIRVDDLRNPQDPVNPYDNGNFSAIALSPSNSSLPHFTFANGSTILWKNYSHGEWDAISSAPSLLETQILGTQWMLPWVLGIVALVIFC